MNIVPVSDHSSGTTRGAKLRQSAAAAISGNAVYAGSQFAVMLLLARLGSATALGQYSYALAIAAPICLFFDLKLRVVLVSDARGEYRTSDYIGMRMVTACLSVSIILILAFAFTNGAHRYLLISVGGYKAAESINDIFYAVMQRQRRFGMIARAQSVRAIASVFILGAVLAISHNVELAVAGMATAMTLLALRSGFQVRSLLDGPLRYTLRINVARSLFVTALPVGLSVLVGSLLVNIPRYFVEHRLGDAALGRFAVISYSVVATDLIAQGVAETALPRLASHAQQSSLSSRLRFQRLIWKLAIAGTTIGIVGVVAALVAARPALSLVFGQQYGRQWMALVVMMAAAGIRYVSLFMGVAINAARLFSLELPVIALACAANILACLGLVHTSLVEAAWAIVIAQTVVLTGYVIAYRRRVIPYLSSSRLIV